MRIEFRWVRAASPLDRNALVSDFEPVKISVTSMDRGVQLAANQQQRFSLKLQVRIVWPEGIEDTPALSGIVNGITVGIPEDLSRYYGYEPDDDGWITIPVDNEVYA